MYCELQEFGRCCFCLPLRRGIILFGYLSIIFSIFMIALYSTTILDENNNYHTLVYHGAITSTPVQLCIAVYAVEIIFYIILLFGAHMKRILFVKIFYYYALVSIVVTFVLQIVLICYKGRWWFLLSEENAMVFAGLCLLGYLTLLVRSLLKKLETNGPQMWENQLNQFVEGEIKVELNGVYNPNSVPISNGA